MDGSQIGRPEADDPAGGREPVLNAPGPPLLLAVLLVGLFLVQDAWGGLRYALVPAHVQAGQLEGLLTSLFLHGGWPHVLLNSAALLAFGAAVARALGPGVRAWLLFIAFYLACGVLAGLAYVWLHPGSADQVIGASGAVAGLMGAASRLLQHRDRPSGFLSAPVLGMGAAWIIVNLIAAVAGTLPGAGGAGIAWEAHLAGYAAGLLLIGPTLQLARPARVDS